MKQRQEKIKTLLMKLAAQFFRDIAGTHSLMTVTNVSISSDMKKATVYFTVLPADKETEALSFAKRKRSDFREYVKRHTSMKFLPYFDMVIDEGERKRQKLDDLLNGHVVK